MEESNYRSVNGRKAAGVKKQFSGEEIELRKGRLEIAREKRLGLIRHRKAELQKKLEAHREHVKLMAQLGIFVPVQDFE